MQPNQPFATFPWPTNFSTNAPVNQWPLPPNFSYCFGHPLTHPHLASPPQNPYNFPVQQQTGALIRQNIPTDECTSTRNLSVVHEDESNDVNSQISDTITNVKEWVIVDLEEDGTFRIAGRQSESGQFHPSGKIVFVNNRGNLLSDGQQTFLLHGPIAWRLYEVQFPGVNVNPDPQLKQAFSRGFPEIDRKRWISKLFDFLQQISSKPSSSQNAVKGHSVLSPTSTSPLIQMNSDDSSKRRQVNGFSYFDENEPIPSITMLEEGDGEDFSSDESEHFRAKSRRNRTRRRLRPKFVEVGVQTLPQKPPERPKMVSKSTSTRTERETSPITDWMRTGCRLDRILQEAYPEDSTQFGSIESPLHNDETGPSSSSRLGNLPPREASKTPSNSKVFNRQTSLKNLKSLRSSSTEGEISKKSSTAAAATRTSHNKSKSVVGVSSSSSSMSNISSVYLKETFPKYGRFENTKEMKAIAMLDDKHTLITQSGIMDVRALRRTRSGRLSIPTRDTLHRQKIVCNGNDISVAHGEFGKYFSSHLDE